MTIYSVENTSKMGKPAHDILDTYGNSIGAGSVVECNTETGECVRFIRKSYYPFFAMDKDRIRIIRRRTIHQAPLTVIFRDGEIGK